MIRPALKASVLMMILAMCAPSARAQAPATEVNPGEVIGVEVIRLEGDGGVAAGATMGGMIGLTYGRSRGHSRAVTRRRTALGAAAGGRLARRAGAGAQEAMEYT
jgi:outer membrane lipoprotein SlyB